MAGRGVENPHAILLLVAHAPAAPQVAIHVDAEAVWRTARFGVDESALVGKLGAVIGNVEDLDDARIGAASTT